MEAFQYMSNIGRFPIPEEGNKGKSFELEMAHKTQSPIGGSQAVLPHFFHTCLSTHTHACVCVCAPLHLVTFLSCIFASILVIR